MWFFWQSDWNDVCSFLHNFEDCVALSEILKMRGGMKKALQALFICGNQILLFQVVSII
jgi:hypothetical protein